MSKVEFSRLAEADIEAILLYHVEIMDEETYARFAAALINEIDKIAASPLLNQPAKGVPTNIRQWLILKNQYRIYFERLGADYIKVLRVWSTRRLPIKPKQIVTTAQAPSSPPTPRKPKSFEDVLGEAPNNSPEYLIYQGLGARVTNRDIEARIEYLQNRARRSLTAEYKRHAITFLQAELGQRRKSE